MLFLPTFWLAGMGPCSFAHPSVMLLGATLFAGLEICGLRMFARNCRTSIRAAFGMGLALVGLVASVLLAYLVYTG